MSSISSFGTDSSLQSLYGRLSSGVSSTQNTDATASTDAPDAPGDPASSQAAQAEGHHHHHHGGPGGAKFKQIESAVTDALAKAKADGTDPQQALKDAIASVVKNGNSASPTDQAGSPAGSPPTDANGDPSAAGQSQGHGDQSAFFQTLSQYGVSADDFRQSLFYALKSAHDPSGTSTPTQGLQVDIAA